MKKIILIFGLVFMALQLFSQADDLCVVHVEKYDNMLYLYMNPPKYDRQSEANKKNIIKTEADKNSVKSVYVISGHRGELWNIGYNFVNIIDSWNMNDASVNSNDNKDQNVRRNLKHPWFFNISASLGTYGNNINLNGYGRFGFYLLKSRWDMAMNCLFGYNKGIGKNKSKGSFSNSIGFDTRVYFPLKQIKVSPFAGLGMSYAFGSDNKSFVMPISAGINVPLWKGCVDACWQYDKINKSVFVIGYTFMLK